MALYMKVAKSCCSRCSEGTTINLLGGGGGKNDFSFWKEWKHMRFPLKFKGYMLYMMMSMWQSRVETNIILSSISGVASLHSKYCISDFQGGAHTCRSLTYMYESFKHSDTIEIQNGIMFVFYLGLPDTCIE